MINKGADQPAHPRSLISAFVFPSLGNIISRHAWSKISNFLLVSVAEQAGLSLALSGTPKTGFVTMRLLYEHLTMPGSLYPTGNARFVISNRKCQVRYIQPEMPGSLYPTGNARLVISNRKCQVRYIQPEMPGSLYQTRRKNSSVYKRFMDLTLCDLYHSSS